MAGGTVIAATSRLARHLQWQYHRQQRRTGNTAWHAPDIVSMSQWLEMLWDRSVVAGGPAGRHNLLTVRQARYVGDLVLRELDPDGRLAGRPAITRLVMQGWEISRYWSISVAELGAAAPSGDGRLFADWARRFEERCRAEDWVDPASLAALVCADLAGGAIACPSPVFLAGFETRTAADKSIIAMLTQLGALAGHIAPSTGDATAYRVSCADSAQEFRRAARWARIRMERQPDAVIGVVVPDLARRAGDLRRRFLDVFDPGWRGHDGAVYPVHVDDGSRLTDAGLVHTALAILELPASAPDYRDFGYLLRTPYIAGAEVEQGERAALDLALRGGKFQRIQPWQVARQERAPLFAKLLGDVLELSEQTGSRREPAEWVAVFDELLQRIGWSAGRPLALDEEQQLAAWKRVLQQFARLGEVTGPIDYRRARRLLAEILQDEPLRPVHGTGGVQIVAPQDAAGHEFDAVWLCGLSSATWPPTPRPNPLVPAGLQRDRGVPEALPDVYRERSVATIRRLIASSGSAVASWSEREGEEELVASPLLDEMTELSGSELAGLDDAPDLRVVIRSGARQETLADDPPPPLDEAERARGGSRVLSLQSNCPARAFFELRLGAQEMPSPPFALDALWRGNLTHDALEILYRGLVDVAEPFAAAEADIETSIEAAADKALDQHIPRRHPLAQTLSSNEKIRLLRLLREMIGLDRTRAPFVVAALEATQEVTIGPLALRLRFDRVDRLDDGRHVVFDYKTGRELSLAVWRGRRPEEPQLPLYAASGHAAGIGFIWLLSAEVKLSGLGATDLGIDGLGGTRGFTADRWPEIVADWQRVLGDLADEYAAGDCRINLDKDRAARGEFAMLTRRFELQWSDVE